jgi:DNA-binding transcriptional LysR family regulator
MVFHSSFNHSVFCRTISCAATYNMLVRFAAMVLNRRHRRLPLVILQIHIMETMPAIISVGGTRCWVAIGRWPKNPSAWRPPWPPLRLPSPPWRGRAMLPGCDWPNPTPGSRVRSSEETLFFQYSAPSCFSQWVLSFLITTLMEELEAL